MQITPYLFFNGNCKEAMEFYASVLGGQCQAMTVGQSPMADQMPNDTDKVINASIMIGDSYLFMASDNIMGSTEGTEHGNTVSISLDCESEEQLRTIYDKLVEGGKPGQTPQDAFWGAVYGDLHDKYGFRWMLNYTKPQA